VSIAGKVIRSVVGLSLAVLSAKAQAPLSLKQALSMARSNNPALKIEAFNIALAESDIITAHLRPNPVLNNQSLQLTDPKFFPPNTGYFNGKNRQVWWQLTKPFQLPAQRRYKIETAQQNVILSQNQFNETARTVFLDVAGKWLDVWTAKKQFDLLQLAKSNSDSLVRINKLRLNNQVATSTDLARTELLAGQYALQLKTAQQVYNAGLAELKFLLGIQQDVAIDTADSFNFAIPLSVDSLLEQALDKRTDIQVLKSAISASGSNIRLQKALAWPNPELGVIYNPQNTIPYVGFYGTIQLPLFSRNQGEIKRSYLLKQQSEQSLLAIKQQVRTALLNAYGAYQTQKSNLQNFTGLQQQAGNILTSVKYAYLRGSTNIVDYLEAQRSWLETQQQYFEALRLYRKASIDLLYASGLINQIAQ
jgi:cobalt-zinc-cadmium efflux system outer membrane protein